MSEPTELRDLLTAMLNMTAFHREHEKFYSVAPREQAVVLQRHSRTLHALADRWTTVTPETANAFSPYEGAEGPQRIRSDTTRRRAVHGR